MKVEKEQALLLHPLDKLLTAKCSYKRNRLVEEVENIQSEIKQKILMQKEKESRLHSL